MALIYAVNYRYLLTDARRTGVRTDCSIWNCRETAVVQMVKPSRHIYCFRHLMVFARNIHRDPEAWDQWL